MSRAELRRDLLALLILLLLPLLWFGPVIFGNQTLLPADNIYQYQPWQSYAAAQGIDVPHNALLSDLVLENYPWKLLIRKAISEGQLPLWNPYQFTGTPFLAAGQHSALYPFSLVYYVLPLAIAYGVFTWLTLALAGINIYIFARVLRMGRAGAMFAAIAFMFSGFFISSVVFPMMIAAAAWLPLLLALIEMVVRKQEEKGNAPFVPVAYIVAGAAGAGAVGLGRACRDHLLHAVGGGHVQPVAIAGRVAPRGRVATGGPHRRLAAVHGRDRVAAGIGATDSRCTNWSPELPRGFGQLRSGRELGLAQPPDSHLRHPRHLRQPRPSRHPRLVDGRTPGCMAERVRRRNPHRILGREKLRRRRATIWASSPWSWPSPPAWMWGGACAGAVRQPADRPGWTRPPTGRFYVIGFALLAVLSLAFAFGTPLYDILFYGLPGYRQLHSAFRWVFPYTLAMAMLAGFGFERLQLAIEGVHFGRWAANDACAASPSPIWRGWRAVY